MQRLISFDVAKAICIILVVVGHYVPGKFSIEVQKFEGFQAL